MRTGFYLGLTLPLLLALAVNAYGLTTFGKSQNNNPNQQPNAQPPVLKGRDCQFEKDCNVINNTSCVPDPLESQVSRCLCGDNQAPVNGKCESKFKGPNHACKAKEECIEGSECMTLKDEGTRGVARVCKCSEGFTEVDFTCSNGVMMDGLSAMATVLLLALPVAVFTN